MDELLIRIVRLDQDALLPDKAHDDDAGYDLHALTGLMIPPGESRLIHTGLALELPQGTEAQIRPRSGLALRHQVTVLNAPGTIDAGYRGEIGVILINHSRREFEVTKGMRIAQLVIGRVVPARLIETDGLEDTARGAGGFGSSGE